jgi:hypothetical protein
MPIKIGEISYSGELMTIYRDVYHDNNRLAITVVCDNGEPYATVSENHPSMYIADNKFVVQSRNLSGDFIAALLSSGLFVHCGAVRFGSFGTMPIWLLKQKGV